MAKSPTLRSIFWYEPGGAIVGHGEADRKRQFAFLNRRREAVHEEIVHGHPAVAAGAAHLHLGARCERDGGPVASGIVVAEAADDGPV